MTQHAEEMQNAEETGGVSHILRRSNPVASPYRPTDTRFHLTWPFWSTPPNTMTTPPTDTEKNVARDVPKDVPKDAVKDTTKDEDVQDHDIIKKRREKGLAEWYEALEEVKRIRAQGQDAFYKAFPMFAGVPLAHTSPDVAISLLEDEFGSA
ncbi:hypothetical protein ACHAPT_002799 [Fusarium lateritium]